MRWVINIPVWGAAYRKRWLERGYPAISAALAHAGFPEHRWIVHTDRFPADEFGCLAHDTVTWCERPRDVAASRELGTADRVGFRDTAVGEAIMFLNADMVPSVEIFRRCEEIFRNTRKTFVSCPSIRTEDVGFAPGLAGAALAEAAWSMRHPFTDDCVWGRGKCKLPPYVIFEKTDVPDNVVMHAFDLHPLAIYKDGDFELIAPTASEFIQEFPWNRIYVVRSPEMMIAEPVVQCEYARFRQRPFARRDVVDWARHAFAARAQQQQFRHQIVLRGLYDPQAQAVANEIYSAAVKPRPWWRFSIPSTMPARIALGLMVPRRIRLLFPKAFRQWFINFEWREMGWPKP